jgi:hypothetical protein
MKCNLNELDKKETCCPKRIIYDNINHMILYVLEDQTGKRSWNYKVKILNSHNMM